MSHRIILTNFPHPSITTGQHTNGPARVWVEIDGTWTDTGSNRLHAVVRELDLHGTTRIKDGTWDQYEASRAGCSKRGE